MSRPSLYSSQTEPNSRDSGAPITPDDAPPFEFTGTIHGMMVDVGAR